MECCNSSSCSANKNRRGSRCRQRSLIGIMTGCFCLLSSSSSAAATGSYAAAARRTGAAFQHGLSSAERTSERTIHRSFHSFVSTSTGSTMFASPRLSHDFDSTVLKRIQRQTESRRTPLLSASRLFSAAGADDANSNESFYATSHDSFPAMGIQSEVLLKRLERLGYDRPSAVQTSLWETLAANPFGDVVVGAETGSGKTLAYLLPLLDDILMAKQKRAKDDSASRLVTYDYARAVILVPNKELAQQVVRMASKLCTDDEDPASCIVWGSTGGAGLASKAVSQTALEDVVRLAVLPGGLYSPDDFKPFRDAVGGSGRDSSSNLAPPIDLLIATPATLGPWGLSPKNIHVFDDITTLVVDEADMLLDGGFQQHLNNILMGFRRADRVAKRQHSYGAWGDDEKVEGESEKVEGERESSRPVTTQHMLVGATIPNYGLKSVDAYIGKKFPKAQRVYLDNMHNARHNGLREQTRWIMDDLEGEGDQSINAQRLTKLVAMLKGDVSETKEGTEEEGLIDLRQDKVMIFLNSVDDVDGVTEALRRGYMQAVPYHAKMGLGESTETKDLSSEPDQAGIGYTGAPSSHAV